MGFDPANPDFERRTRASFARQGAMAYLGAVLGKVEPGRVEISLAFRPELSQQHGEVIRSGRTLTVCRLDAFVEKSGKRTHCATGPQTLMAVVGRAGVKD